MRWGCQRNNQRSPKTLLFVFRRFACLPAAFLSVWGGQPEREASLFNLKFLAARVRVYVRQLADGRVFAAVCGQPVFEVGVVGADEDGGVFVVKIDFGGLFLLGKSCSHRLILSAALSRNRGVFRGFSSALDLGKMAVFKQERAGRRLPCPTRSHSIKCVFSGSTQESASFVPRDRFFSERMEESPQIITLNYIPIAADFPAQLRIFTLQFCRTELAVDRLIIRNCGYPFKLPLHFSQPPSPLFRLCAIFQDVTPTNQTSCKSDAQIQLAACFGYAFCWQRTVIRA